MTSRVEFIGGPKDGEVVYSRTEYLAESWVQPVLSLRLSTEPEEYYVYRLKMVTPTAHNYMYEGVLVKD
jgi:hypothetical protein